MTSVRSIAMSLLTIIYGNDVSCVTGRQNIHSAIFHVLLFMSSYTIVYNIYNVIKKNRNSVTHESSR